MPVLEPALYWELRARQRDVEVFVRDLQLAASSPWKDDGDVVALMRSRLDAAMEARAEVWDRASLNGAHYNWDDETCSLTAANGLASETRNEPHSARQP